MSYGFRYRVKVSTPGIDSAPDIYAYWIRKRLEELGPELVEAVQREQRISSGEERRRTRSQIKGRGTNLSLSVYNTSIQAFVDETGARPHFPPYKKGSDLFKWVQRTGLGQDVSRGEASYIYGRTARAVGQLLGAGAVKEHNLDVDKQVERVSFLIARAQSRRGLPRPGDVLRAPFKDVQARYRQYIEGSMRIAFSLATAHVARAETASRLSSFGI